MSRVITCPPLVLGRNQASVQNLVKSTKLERIIIGSKKAHRIEKKEKKEKRKPKKESKGDKPRKHSSRNRKQIFLSPKKVSDDESDQLEKSDLTEEHEEPLKQVGYLSDGSQNSKKRKRDDSPPPVESFIKVVPDADNPLKLILRLRKKPQAEVRVLPLADVVCSTSDTKSLSHQDVITSSLSASKVFEPEIQLSAPVAAIVETKKIKKHRPSKDDQYNALFDDWTPSPICLPDASFLKDDGDDWLFGKKRQEIVKPKAAVNIDEDMKMRSGDSSWPRAQFLSEVGIYSLPYTVPF